MSAVGPVSPLGPGSATPGFFRSLRSLRAIAGPAGLAPALVLVALSGVERFDANAFGVLGPEIRDQFHLSSAGYVVIATLTSVLPLLVTAHVGYLSDRYNRIHLAAASAVVWGLTAVLTGLAPATAVLILARLAGGIGYTVNTPTHPSLLADWYAPKVLPIVFGWYLVAYSAINLLSGPLAGGIAAVSSWRIAFVVLALPTLLFALVLLKFREPARGESMGLALRREDATGVIRSFRRLAAMPSMPRTWASATFFGAGLVVLASLLSLYFQDVWGYGPATRGAISALFGLGGLGGLLLGGHLGRQAVAADRVERLPVIVGLTFLVGLAGGMILLAGAVSGAMAVVAVLIASIAYGGWGPAYYTQMSMITPPDVRGQAFAWSTIWFSVGGVIASPLIGRVGDVWGQRSAVVVLAVLVAVAGALALWVSPVLRRDVEATRRLVGERASDHAKVAPGLP
ncbi:MAG TPA: MFS transporter [Candidatus Dormibacteraeota bacterium]|nr:MFS transporter [Candidatus Dormibacteraeota bacterium]